MRVVQEGSATQSKIEAEDSPGPGGASFNYAVRAHADNRLLGRVVFQDGSISEVGHNGVTNAELLTIVLDRLSSFQEGPFACEENDQAITSVKAALAALAARASRREQDGTTGKLVESTPKLPKVAKSPKPA